MLTEFLEEYMEPLYTAEAFELYRDVILFIEAGANESIQEDLVAKLLSPLETSMRDESLDDDDNDIDVKSDSGSIPEEVGRDQLVSYLETELRSMIRNFGVTVSDVATMREMYQLLVGLYSIDKYEDGATIVQIVSIDTDNIERLSQALEVVMAEPASYYEGFVEDVSDDLIRAIQKLTIERIEDAYAEMEDSEMRQYLTRIRAYREYMQSRGFDNLNIYEFISTIVMGQDLETYLNSGFLSETISNNNFEKIGNEIYGLALVSSQSSDPLGAIRDVAEKFLGDSHRVLQLNNEAIRINGGFSKFLQEAINREKGGGSL